MTTNPSNLRIALDTSGRVRVCYERTGRRFYRDTATGNELSAEEVYSLLDEEIKRPKCFMDAFERSLVMRTL